MREVVSITGARTEVIGADNTTGKNITFKNYFLFKINNVKYPSVVMRINKLLEYVGNYTKASRRLCQYTKMKLMIRYYKANSWI